MESQPSAALTARPKTSCLRATLSHNDGVKSCRYSLALLPLLMAGCATRESYGVRHEDPLVPNQEIVLIKVPEPTGPAEPKKDFAPAPVSAPVVVPAPTAAPPSLPVQNPPPPGFVRFPETWVSLDQWSQVNGFGPIRKSGSDIQPAYFLTATNGTMNVKTGSQSAFWNGMEYRLGFAPQLIDGHPFVHTLDLQKNFEPLLDNPAPMKTNPVIVIDAGHGGSDIGTTNVFNGRFEKEFTLDWAKRLQALLVTNGCTVWMTRSADTTLPLSNRVAFAEQHKADLFVSLHFNSSFPDKQQSGLETYCLTPRGMPSNLTRGYSDNSSELYPNNNFDKANLQLAAQLHRAVLNVNGHLDRGVRRARFLGVLQNQNRPAVLVEGGYLSNPTEARQIADPAYRQKLAEAIAQALTGGAVTITTNLVSQAPAMPASTNLDGKVN